MTDPGITWIRWLACVALVCWHGLSGAQPATVLRSSELRADKLPSAQQIDTLAKGTGVNVRSLEGGWALIDVGADASGQAKRTGWIRAGALDLSVPASAASTAPNGRQGATQVVVSLGVRGQPVPDIRHALFIGVGRYADPTIPALPGVRTDRESVTQIALTMGVPRDKISYVTDAQATREGIRDALAELNQSVALGDRVMVYFSGYGTRTTAGKEADCASAFLSHDGAVIDLASLARLLRSIAVKAEMLVVVLDAGFAPGGGGEGDLASGWLNANDDGRLRSRFLASRDHCSLSENADAASRALLVAETANGALSQTLVYLSSGPDGGQAFEDESKGGLVTEFLRDCMLRDAARGNDGAVTMPAIKSCVQAKLDSRLRGDSRLRAQSLSMDGNLAITPSRFGSLASATSPMEKQESSGR